MDAMERLVDVLPTRIDAADDIMHSGHLKHLEVVHLVKMEDIGWSRSLSKHPMWIRQDPRTAFGRDPNPGILKVKRVSHQRLTSFVQLHPCLRRSTRTHHHMLLTSSDMAETSFASFHPQDESTYDMTRFVLDDELARRPPAARAWCHRPCSVVHAALRIQNQPSVSHRTLRPQPRAWGADKDPAPFKFIRSPAACYALGTVR